MEKIVKEKKNGLLMSKRKLIFNIILIVLVTGLTVYTMLSTGVFSDLSPLGNLKWWNFLIIVGLIIAYVLLEAFVIYRQFRRINPKMKYKDCIGTYLYSNLGSNITPAKTGHHPFRIYYLERKGNTFAQALANATQCQIIYTLVQTVLYSAMTVVCLVKGVTINFGGSEIPMYLVGLIGIALSFIASGVFIIMAFFPPVRKIIVRFLAWINYKMKKIQTKEEYIEAQDEKMKMVREQIIMMFTHFWEIIPSILVYVVNIVLSNCLPYFIFIIIGQEWFDFGKMCYFFALYQCISYISNIVPVPGNSGSAEGMFKALFASVIPNAGVLNCTLLLWRLLSYYAVLIFEAVYFISSTVVMDATKEKKLHIILNETKKGWTPEVHSHFDTMEMELLSVNFKETQCYNCCHLQNNLFQCDKFKNKPDEILKNIKRCPYYQERDNGEDL